MDQLSRLLENLGQNGWTLQGTTPEVAAKHIRTGNGVRVSSGQRWLYFRRTDGDGRVLLGAGEGANRRASFSVRIGDADGRLTSRQDGYVPLTEEHLSTAATKGLSVIV